MTTDALDLRLLVASAVVRDAGQLARDFFLRREQLEIEHKGMQDLVSIADRQVEEVIRRQLASAFPDDGIIGEEGETIEPSAGAGSWVIDPIDGTANFLRGVPYWSVTLTDVGITYDPNHDELFAAARGKGATRDGRPIRVSGCSDMSRAIVGSSFTFKMRVGDYLDLLRGILGAGADHRRLGSTALMMAHVADGRLDGCATLYCNSWDIIGGLLLVQEAGGVASDFLDGATLAEPNRVFGCTPALAETIAALVGLRT